MKSTVALIVIFLVGLVTFEDAFSQGRKRSYSQSKKSRKHASKSRQMSRFNGGRASGIGADEKYLSIGVAVNALNYFGDLAPKSNIVSTELSFTRPGFGVFVDKRFSSRFHGRASLSWGRLQGDDISADPNDELGGKRYIRNLHFRNDIKELALSASFDLWGERTFVTSVKPYIFLGLGVFHHNPKALGAPGTEQAGQWIDLKPLGTEGQFSPHVNVKTYSNFQFSLPFGIGLRYKINRQILLGFEIGYRWLFFDYIDDVSGEYVDPGVFDSEIARKMADRSQEEVGAVTGEKRIISLTPSAYTSIIDEQTYTLLPGYGSPYNIRGNPKDNDIYIITGIHLYYVLGQQRFGQAKFR